SSLLNALAGDDIAIVTPIAGTTRDKVIQQIHIDGVPMHIIDTAGLRDTDDTVESIGIARSWAEIEKANVIIHLQDARKPNDELDSAITARLPARTPVLKVYNKLDLLSGAALASAINQTDEAVLPASGTRQVARQPAPAPASKEQSAEHGQTTVLHISAKTGQGLDSLRRRLLDIAGWSPGAESPWLARERHLFALDAA